MKHSFGSRRDFLRLLPGVVLSPLYLTACSDDSNDVGATAPPPPGPKPARSSAVNPYLTPDGRPILVSVEGNNFASMLDAGLQELDGLSRLVGPDKPVLVKPNCNAVDIYPGVSSAGSVAAVVAAVRQVTSGSVAVGDTGYHPPSEVYPHMALQEAVAGAGGTLITFSGRPYLVRGSGWDDSIPDCRVYREVYDASVIINLCSLKRHRFGVMSCALKNNVGAITGASMAGSRSYLHRLDGDDFMRWVAEIGNLVRPELSIVDARKVLGSDGPFVEWGDVIPANRVILCGDMVATDAYCAQLLASVDSTFDAASYRPALEHAERLGIGAADLSQVEVVELSV